MEINMEIIWVYYEIYARENKQAGEIILGGG